MSLSRTVLLVVFSLFSLIALVLFLSYDTTSNKTNAGYFWYHGEYCEGVTPGNKDEEASNSKLVNYQHSMRVGNNQVVTIYKMVPNDPSVYYKGSAEIKRDTLYLDIKEESRVCHYFDTEMKACASVFIFYFASPKIARTIYLWGQPMDSLKNQVIL